MVSLAQVGILGVAGMTFANLVVADGGLAAAWSPWPATIAALVVATAVGLGFGAIAARSEGIYFLMITLAFSVLVYYFFSQVTQLSGFGGVNNLDLPTLVGDPGADPAPLYYTTLVASVLVFLGLRYISLAPFGLALQGLRDEPARMRALGFDVTRHRMLAFALAAFVAAVAGVLSVWYNRRVSPGSINLEQTINVLIIAVVGGLYRLEGAWVGALVYALTRASGPPRSARSSGPSASTRSSGSSSWSSSCSPPVA
jgi:branched-chain amino acid transport system permease protein